MKLTDIMEDVVDLAAARAKRAAQSATQPIDPEFELDFSNKLSNQEKAASAEYTAFGDWRDDLFKKMRVPGFESFSDVMFHLVVTLKLRGYNNPTQVAQWFRKLPPQEQAKVKMIAHHVPRFLKMLDSVEERLIPLRKRWDKYDDFSGSHYQAELDNDRKLVNAIATLA